jgi:hypothetical protein
MLSTGTGVGVGVAVGSGIGEVVGAGVGVGVGVGAFTLIVMQPLPAMTSTTKIANTNRDDRLRSKRLPAHVKIMYRITHY